jgi:hypothetical protein
MLLVSNALLGAALTYFGGMYCYEYTAPMWIAAVFFGGMFTTLTVLDLMGGK